MEDPTVPEKRLVLHPATAAARRHDRQRAYGSHVRGHTVDNSEVLDLMRRHRLIGISIAVVQVLVGISLLMLFSIWPSVGAWQPIGSIPFAWLAPGPIALSSIVVSAFLHERLAVRIDDTWSKDHE